MNEQKQIPFWPVMIAIFFGSFLAILSISTINLAIPILMTDFHTDLPTVQWTLTGFMLATGVVAPLTGYISDKFSTKFLYVGALIGFTLMSVLCSLAWNIESLIVFRILQGICSGAVMPVTMTIIYQVIPREKQPTALSLLSLSAMLAPALGPTIAGYLIESFDWKWLFFMNIPFGIAAILLAAKLIPYYKLNQPIRSFDGIGLVSVIVSSASLLVVFSQGHSWGWTSGRIITLLALGVVVLAYFIRRELKLETPLLNLRVFKYGRYTYSMLLSSIITISLYAGTLLAPLFLQNVQGLSALDAGLILLPASLVMALFMPLTGKLYQWLGPVPLVCSGIICIALGTWEMGHLEVHTSHSTFILWMTVRNIGISLSNMPASNPGMIDVPRTLSGHASSVNNWIRQATGSLALGFFSSILATKTIAHSAILHQIDPTVSKIELTKHAFTLGMNDVFYMATFIALFALPFSILLRKPLKPSAEPAVT